MRPSGTLLCGHGLDSRFALLLRLHDPEDFFPFRLYPYISIYLWTVRFSSNPHMIFGKSHVISGHSQS